MIKGADVSDKISCGSRQTITAGRGGGGYNTVAVINKDDWDIGFTG